MSLIGTLSRPDRRRRPNRGDSAVTLAQNHGLDIRLLPPQDKVVAFSTAIRTHAESKKPSRSAAARFELFSSRHTRTSIISVIMSIFAGTITCQSRPLSQETIIRTILRTVSHNESTAGHAESPQDHHSCRDSLAWFQFRIRQCELKFGAAEKYAIGRPPSLETPPFG